MIVIAAIAMLYAVILAECLYQKYRDDRREVETYFELMRRHTLKDDGSTW